jgi:hypothetical protein
MRVKIIWDKDSGYDPDFLDTDNITSSSVTDCLQALETFYDDGELYHAKAIEQLKEVARSNDLMKEKERLDRDKSILENWKTGINKFGKLGYLQRNLDFAIVSSLASYY